MILIFFVQYKVIYSFFFLFRLSFVGRFSFLLFISFRNLFFLFSTCRQLFLQFVIIICSVELVTICLGVNVFFILDVFLLQRKRIFSILSMAMIDFEFRFNVQMFLLMFLVRKIWYFFSVKMLFSLSLVSIFRFILVVCLSQQIILQLEKFDIIMLIRKFLLAVLQIFWGCQFLGVVINVCDFSCFTMFIVLLQELVQISFFFLVMLMSLGWRVQVVLIVFWTVLNMFIQVRIWFVSLIQVSWVFIQVILYRFLRFVGMLVDIIVCWFSKEVLVIVFCFI